MAHAAISVNNFKNLDFQKRKCYGIVSRLPKGSRQLVLAALRSAEELHRDQTRLDHTPQIIHIYRVLIFLAKEFRVSDPQMLAACALHDVLEDCDMTEDDMLQKFGKDVTDMVKSESQNLFPDRKDYMKHFEYEPDYVKKIKISDRIDNLLSISHLNKKDWSDKKRVQYAIESERYILPISRDVDAKAYKKMAALIKKFKEGRFGKLYAKLAADEQQAYREY